MSDLPDPSVFTGAAARDLVPLPRAAALMLWAGAYLRGDIGPDDAAIAARGSGHRHAEISGEDLFDWMTGLRRIPLVSLQLVLPVPGRIAGLIGPPAAIGAALEAEQAIVVGAAGLADHTLVPAAEPIGSEGMRGVHVQWERFAAPPGAATAPPMLGGSARRDFLRSLHRAASGTVALDLVPEEQVELASLPPGWTATLPPPGLAPSDQQQLVLTARTLLLAGQELLSPGTARALAEESARAQVLRQLRDGAREALAETVGGIAADGLR